MKRALTIAAGIAMCLLALWGGGYLMHIFPFTHWASFAAFSTSVMVFIGGVGLSVYGLAEMKP